MKSIRRAVAAAVAAAVLLPLAAFAQGTYPNRPVRIYLPFAPGGATDVLARLLANYNEKRFGQPFVVENRPGGFTLIGVDAALKSPNDGYSLLVTSSNVVTEEALNPDWTPRLARDYTTISLFAGGGYALVSSANIPVNSLADLVSYTRANPGKLNQAQAGAISSDMEILKHRLKMGPLESVLYKGGPLSVQAIVAGEAHLYGAAVLDVVQLEKAGKLKILLYTERDRHPLIPHVPTARETNLGIDDFEAGFIFALQGPANLPAEVVSKLSAAALDMIRAPEFTGMAVDKFGMRTYSLTPQQSHARLLATLKSYVDAKNAGLKLR